MKSEQYLLKVSAKAGPVYRAHQSSMFLLQLLPMKSAKPWSFRRCDRTTISSPSQRISHWACLEKETPSHADNVTQPTGTTERLSFDLSVHQSTSYLHWNTPVNKSCKSIDIFILPRKKWKWSWKAFGHGELPCQAWILEAFDSSSHHQIESWSCFISNFSKRVQHQKQSIVGSICMVTAFTSAMGELPTSSLKKKSF